MDRRPMSLDTGELWHKRLGEHLSESIYYLRLVGSSGGLFTVILLFILALMYYEDLMALIPEQTPLPLLFSLIIAGVITRVRFRTLLHEADLLFLPTIEGKMEEYFRKAGRYNLAVQIFHVAVVLIALTPIYTHKIPVQHQQLWLYFLLPFLLKGWNLHSAWNALQVQEQQLVFRHMLSRFIITFALLYLFFTGGSFAGYSLWLIVLPLVALTLILLYVQEKRWQAKQVFNWLVLVEMDNHLRNRFYGFVNAFTDVPQLRGKVRKRAWLSFLTAWIPFKPGMSFKYLYLKTFIRANEYFGLYIRLSIIGLLIVTFLPDVYSKGLAYLLFLWMACTQLKALWGHHARQFWVELYPLPKELHQAAYIWLLTILLVIQAIFMLIPALATWQGLANTLVTLVIGLAFSYLYPHLILKRKLGSNRS